MTPKRPLLKREDRMASIQRAAARAFVAGGFTGTSMEDIAAEAGITKLIIYRHFDSKQQLYEAVLDGMRERLAVVLGARDRAPGPDMVQPLIAVARADPEAFTLLFRHASRESQFAGYVNDFRSTATDYAEQALRPMIVDGIRRRWLASLLFTVTIEGVLAALELNDPATDGELAALLLRANAAITAAVADQP